VRTVGEREKRADINARRVYIEQTAKARTQGDGSLPGFTRKHDYQTYAIPLPSHEGVISHERLKSAPFNTRPFCPSARLAEAEVEAGAPAETAYRATQNSVELFGPRVCRGDMDNGLARCYSRPS
jgi:hypothetical protein